MFRKLYFFSLSSFFILYCITPGFAAEDNSLEQRIQNLENELEELREKTDEKKELLDRDSFGELPDFLDRISLSGLVEVEGAYSSGYDDEDESDVQVATVEMGVDADLHEFVSSHVLFLWEEGEGEDITVDEAFITLGNTDKFPIIADLGRQYVPFGKFETHMVSDPLTLELGETQESAALVGFEYNGLYGGAYAFNGDVNEDSGEDHVENFGANLGYTLKRQDFGLDLQAGYISSIADTDGVEDALMTDDVQDYADGLTGSAKMTYRDFTLIGEYMTALDEFNSEELEFAGQGAEPEAWNLELGYTFDLSGRETTLAAAYQGTDQALALELPEERYMAVASMGFFDNLVSLSLEYAYDEDYSRSEGGTGEDAHTITSQMALAF